MSKVIAENIAPIHEWSGNVPEEGGAVVLTGKSEVGKSRLTNAIIRLATGIKDYDVAVTDGEESGELSFAGGTLKVGRNVRVTGQCEYFAVDPVFLNRLIDPGIKDESAADASRVEALIELAGVKADCDLFVDLCESKEEFEEIMPADLCEEVSLVKMGARVARVFQERARVSEKESEQEEGKAIAKRGSTTELDLTAESDGKVLQLLLEKTIQSESDLKAKDADAVRAAGLAENAKKQLEAVAATYTGKTLEQALADHKLAVAEQQSADDKVSQLQSQLSEAQKAAGAARNAVDLAVSNGRAARQHEESMKAWREQLAASIPPRVDPADLAKASQSVLEARQAVENGALIRKAKELTSEVSGHAEKAKTLKAKAKRLRDAADGTDDILSRAVASAKCPLKVHRGRLVMDTDRMEKEPFARRSAGARAKVAIDISLDNIPAGRKGLIGLDQKIWGEFNPSTRLELAEHARSRGAVIWTGLCTDEKELGMEVLP